ncbi:MAG TPA: hypothetical protein VFL17_18840 [Anaerolineae bacterium]|nr:hypothetical protein [Anaerolineae bacterium]
MARALVALVETSAPFCSHLAEDGSSEEAQWQLSPNDRHRQAFQIGDKLFECQQARAVCFGRSDDRGGKAMPGEQRQMYRPKFTAITSI